MWVFDATPLVYLTKADRLPLLADLDEPRLVPERVYREVVTRGLEEGYPDARRIERGVEEGPLEVVTVEGSDTLDRLGENPNLSGADAAVLACAAERGATAVMDEAYGRDVAAVEGIGTRGTAYLLVLLVRRSAITPGTARETLDGMLDAGWYCSPDLFATLVGKLEELQGEE
jgi:predicted nucleic acid-binding protein